ncbi:heavy metal translocating P-type ATPase [Arenimonas fontis]|uniref:Cadmium-translocating P-type ATPase n=1 Tax=Arenimonas fontis TaxID=2608255 RepID=A0A5B2Z7X8_9GAMM|nr:heavy metal translocating P-type ATPase [Arenimonas fontis]KAA2284848.1 cadmium-translocating P-type ATPase [Arenimonas fontis]
MNRSLATACHHCGEPLPATPVLVELDGQARAMCCNGCAAAAAWIRDAGLDDYYRLRQAPGAKVDEAVADYRSWDREDVQAGHVEHGSDGDRITVVVEGMHCAACAWLIDRALQREPGLHEVSANAVTGRVRLAWDPSRTRLSVLLQRLAALGYRPHLARGEQAERERRRERNRLIARLGVAALGATQAMMFSEALYLDTAGQMPTATRDFFRWLSFLTSTPVVFYSGWPFLAGMARELRLRRPGMDTLVASSVLLAYFASLAETLRGGTHVWFDAAVMFVFFLLAARFLERMARRKASARLDTLARAQPALAWREGGEGLEQVPAATLRAGDRVRVGVGEAVPADGELESAASFDESLLTGEPVPVPRRAGDTVYAGSTCRESACWLRVLRTGADTRLSQLARAVEQAQAQRPRLARLAEAVSMRFVLFLFAAALVAGLVWWKVQPERAFEVALAVLVVSCPCALSLAVPTALATAHGALARLGVLALRPDGLDALADADIVVFDKTGTLTLGQPELHDVQCFGAEGREAVLSLAAALEHGAGHPLAHAFGTGTAATEDLQAHPGLGVEGRVAGRLLRLGRADFAAGRDDDGALWLGDGRQALARFDVADRLRPDAADTVAGLRRLGLRPVLLSGDAATPVSEAAAAVGIAEHAHRLSPEGKLARVRDLQRAGHRVLMLGDGINDAPVLAGADVSVAMAGGAPLAHRAADLVLTGTRLDRVPQAVLLARRNRRVIHQNLVWAMAYNLLALPFAALGWVSPGLAALGMAASSLLVTGNALRLGRLPAESA